MCFVCLSRIGYNFVNKKYTTKIENFGAIDFSIFYQYSYNEFRSSNPAATPSHVV